MAQRETREPRRRGEQGAVTAELAMGLPLLLAVTTVLVWCLSLGLAQVRVIDASREAARAVARGDDEGRAVATAQRIAPSGAQVRVVRAGDEVRVTTTVRVAGPGGLVVWPRVRLVSESIAWEEGQ